MGLGALSVGARAFLPPTLLGRGPLDFAVIGLGRAGMRHLDELLDIPGCRVLAVCDVFEARQERARKKVDQPASAR